MDRLPSNLPPTLAGLGQPQLLDDDDLSVPTHIGKDALLDLKEYHKQYEGDRQWITSPLKNDIYGQRGGQSTSPKNVSQYKFMKKVRLYRKPYNATKDAQKRKAYRNKLIRWVYKRGGRFLTRTILDEHGKPVKDKNDKVKKGKLRVMSLGEVITKISSTLRVTVRKPKVSTKKVEKVKGDMKEDGNSFDEDFDTKPTATDVKLVRVDSINAKNNGYEDSHTIIDAATRNIPFDFSIGIYHDTNEYCQGNYQTVATDSAMTCSGKEVSIVQNVATNGVVINSITKGFGTDVHSAFGVKSPFENDYEGFDHNSLNHNIPNCLLQPTGNVATRNKWSLKKYKEEDENSFDEDFDTNSTFTQDIYDFFFSDWSYKKEKVEEVKEDVKDDENSFDEDSVTNTISTQDLIDLVYNDW